MATNDEQAILKEIEAFSQAWNSGDAKAAAAFFASDGVRVGAFGDIQRRRAEIEAAYDKLLHESMPGAVMTLGEGSVRMLSSEFAVWQAGIEVIPPGGGAALKGHVVQVMQKVAERWLVLEAHPKFFPPPQ